MKKIPFIFLFLGGLLLINAIPVSTYLNFGEGKHLYEQGAFEQSLGFFAGESDAELYNQALALYKTKDFVGAKEVFQKIDTDDEELNFKIAHNLGNIHYRLFEESTDPSQLDEAIEAYKSALVFKEDEETRKNLQFVKQKKNELEEKEDEEQSSQEQENKKEGDAQNSDEKETDNQDGEEQAGKENTEKDTEKQESEKKGESKSGEEGEKTEGEEADSEKSEQGGENEENGGSPVQDSSSGKQESVFTEEQQQQLEEYEQNLQNEQMQNSGNYGKVYDDPNARSNDLFQLLQGDPYFDSGFGNGEEVKDW